MNCALSGSPRSVPRRAGLHFLSRRPNVFANLFASLIAGVGIFKTCTAPARHRTDVDRSPSLSALRYMSYDSTIATRLNATGIGMKTIQLLMGHQHISTTALYCKVSDNILRNAVELVSVAFG